MIQKSTNNQQNPPKYLKISCKPKSVQYPIYLVAINWNCKYQEVSILVDLECTEPLLSLLMVK
jgi:hypothetical protein